MKPYNNTSDRAERLRDLHAQMEHQVADLVTGEDWARMLYVASRFHRYSFGNVCLIMAQKPTATRVAGFQTWKQVGRCVRKGEHGIRILAPCTYKKHDEETDRDVWQLAGFTTVSVFDVSQTDGADLPDVRPSLVEGKAPAGLWDALAKQVAAAGYMLALCPSAEDIHGANGLTSFVARTVTVRADVSDAQRCKTLAHELGHILCDHEHERGLGWMGCRGRHEVEAESVAYIVCAASGMVTEGYSLPYVAKWADGNTDMVRETAERVCSVARTILETLETLGEES
jgi:antirestriction protein ArdC